eukprot:459010-Amphidinium_carterae.1
MKPTAPTTYSLRDPCITGATTQASTDVTLSQEAKKGINNSLILASSTQPSCIRPMSRAQTPSALMYLVVVHRADHHGPGKHALTLP